MGKNRAGSDIWMFPSELLNIVAQLVMPVGETLKPPFGFKVSPTGITNRATILRSLEGNIQISEPALFFAMVQKVRTFLVTGFFLFFRFPEIWLPVSFGLFYVTERVRPEFFWTFALRSKRCKLLQNKDATVLGQVLGYANQILPCF
jgi:hypothetical protein